MVARELLNCHFSDERAHMRLFRILRMAFAMPTAFRLGGCWVNDLEPVSRWQRDARTIERIKVNKFPDR